MHGLLVQPVQRRDRAVACYDQCGPDETEDRHDRRRKGPAPDCPRRRGERRSSGTCWHDRILKANMLCQMSKIVEAVEAWHKQHGTPRVAPPHRPENTSQGIASSGHTWMHVRGRQRSRMATEKREPLSAQNRPCWQALYQSRPPRSSAQEKRARGCSRCGSAGLERFWSGTLVGSLNFVNAAGLRPQDSAFVGLSNFPSFDRNHADEELGKLRFGFF